MSKLTPQDNQKIESFRKLFPKRIEVMVNFSEDGGYWAEVKTFPGCFTQAETFSELIEMVNDAVATILEIPRNYLPYMPTYLPPTSLAEKFNLFPCLRIINNPVTFSIL